MIGEHVAALEDVSMRQHTVAIAAVFSALALSAIGIALAQDSSTTVTCKDGSTVKAGKDPCSQQGGVSDVKSNLNQGGPAAASAITATAATPANSSAPAAPAAGRTQMTTPGAAPKTVAPSSSSPTSSAERPTGENADPTGATARCKDNTYSHARNRADACRQNGGVAQWMATQAK